MGHKFVAGKSPGDRGNAESLGSRMYVSCCNGSIFASRRIRFHAWGARGCTGIREERTNRSSPHQPPFFFFPLFFFCTSAFREKENPEEITLPTVGIAYIKNRVSYPFPLICYQLSIARTSKKSAKKKSDGGTTRCTFRWTPRWFSTT